MTSEQAKIEQERLEKDGFKLSWWFGTGCKKCCGVYPKHIDKNTNLDSKMRYECMVCHKKTKWVDMPWIAEKEWNNGNFVNECVQLSFL